MSAILETAMKVVSGAAKVGKHGLFGSTATRAAIGAGVGALYGAVTNPYDDTETAMNRIGRTALYGGVLGAASRLLLPTFKNGKVTGVPLGWKAARSLMGPSMRAGYAGAQAGVSLAGWALAHPGSTALAAGGIYAAYQFNKTPYSSRLEQSYVNQALFDTDNIDVNTSIGRENAMLEQMQAGIAPMATSTSGTQLRNQRMMQSTFGLTQGLHSGRHG